MAIRRARSVSEPHFDVLEEFDGASYVDRGEQL